MNTAELKPANRISHLDGLRGLLALTIFVHHFLYCFAPNFIVGGISREQILTGHYTIYGWFAYTPLNLLYNPGMAVDFFFVLSGYVLSFSYFSKQDIQIVQQNFIKRYFRLALPVLALCIIIWICHKLHLIYREPFPQSDVNANWLPGILPDYLGFWEVIKYSLLDVFGSNSRYCSVLWTMGIELMGSILVFISLFVTHKIADKRKKLFLLVTLLAFSCYIYNVLLASFILGMIICFLQTNSAKFVTMVSAPYMKIIFLILGLYLASFPFIQDESMLNTTMYGFIYKQKLAGIQEYYYVLGCSLILTVALFSQKMKRIFSSKPFAFLGKISFALYLIHLPLLFVISSRVYKFFYKYFFDAISMPITFVISLLCLFGVSWLFYRFVDVYAVKWASRIGKFFVKQA